MTAPRHPDSLPLELGAALAAEGRDFILLHSGMRTAYSGGQSLLLWDFAEHCVTGDPAEAARLLRHDGDWRDPLWAGYLGYGLRHAAEPGLRHDRADAAMSIGSALPDIHLVRPKGVWRFDHDRGQAEAWHAEGKALPAPRALMHDVPAVSELTSPCSRSRYLADVAHIVAEIHKGELYQANLTRKFTGRFAEKPDDYALFCRLAVASPGTYSAFLRLGDVSLLSSSPERFLTLAPDGHIESRPIKGTAPRSADPSEDAANRRNLAASPKDRAENLMIVDLMRHDLAKSCVPGSVKVEDLFEVSSYRTVHHMASTIQGQLQPGLSPWRAVLGCFPPGSMTGAPKIRAMDLCTELEIYRRGVYSGAIGWFGGDGRVDLSVVIRTLVLQGDRFEFQVGGGIVADSDPEAEWRETLTKARGLMQALGLAMDRLATL